MKNSMNSVPLSVQKRNYTENLYVLREFLERYLQTGNRVGPWGTDGGSD